MRQKEILKYRQREIEQHLKSAMDQLTPSVLERIDLSMPQEKLLPQKSASILKLGIRLKPVLVAACCCLLLMSGSVYYYQENQIVSVVDLDVNPSVEFSLNRREKVLSVRAVNSDAEGLIKADELRGKQFKLAIQTVIQSMLQEGYLQNQENAVLISVTPVKELETVKIEEAIVQDVKSSLAENRVQAVVYNQKVVVSSEVEELAKEYNISQGKAYFLKEMIEQNESLTMASMNELSALKMDQLSAEITAGNYVINDTVSIIASSLDETVGDELGDLFFEAEPDFSEVVLEESMESEGRSTAGLPESEWYEAMTDESEAESPDEGDLGSTAHSTKSTNSYVTDSIVTDSTEELSVATPSDLEASSSTIESTEESSPIRVEQDLPDPVIASEEDVIPSTAHSEDDIRESTTRKKKKIVRTEKYTEE